MSSKVIANVTTTNTSSKKAPVKASKEDVVSEEEYNQMMEACGGGALGARNQAILAFLRSSGLRRGELCALEMQYLDMKKRQVRVINGKGGTDLKSGFDSITAILIQRWLEVRESLGISKNTGFVFCRTSKGIGGPLLPSYIYNMIRRVSAKAGITKIIHPHMLRRTCATTMLNRGSTLDMVMTQLRHASTASTHRYIRAADTDRLPGDTELRFANRDHLSANIRRIVEDFEASELAR